MMQTNTLKQAFRLWERCSTPCLTALLFALGLAGTPAVAADDYPNRPIQMIIPFPAGGPADFVGRLYAQYLGKLAGQAVVVENPSGASGTIGTRTAARAEPDGYTILYGTTSTMAINQVIMKNLPYDFARDFALIGLIANAPHILAVRANLPAKTARELITLAKESPGKYTFASAGVGTIIQMGGELFKTQTGIDILHVPFKGGGPATMALLTGDVDMTVNDLTTLKTHFASGKLRPLAVANPTRLKLLPDTPTFTELGYPKIISSTWWGISVPVKTPAQIQAKLKTMHDKIITNPEFVARLAEMAIEPLNLTPEQSKAFIQDEVQKWKAVALTAKIQLD